MAQPLDYYDPQGLSVVFYDLLSARDPTLEGDVAFYAGLIPHGSWVLELGCGTGRVGLPLAQDDRAVVGLDLSPAMLQRALAKRAGLAPEVQARTAFVLGDMTDFDLGHRFDAVIAPYFGVSHLPAGEARRKTMACIARHLQPGGLAVLHAVLPAVFATPVEGDPRRMLMDLAFNPEGERLQLSVAELAYDPARAHFTQVLDYVVTGSDGAERKRSRERLEFFLTDLEADAEGSGLSLERKVSPFNTIGEMWLFRKG